VVEVGLTVLVLSPNNGDLAELSLSVVDLSADDSSLSPVVWSEGRWSPVALRLGELSQWLAMMTAP